MKRLYLHLGMDPASTTALQRLLHGNRERLSRLGVLYPDIDPSDDGGLAAALRACDQQSILGVLTSVEASRHPAVLLSSADWACRAPDLAFLRENAPVVTPLLYLPRQDRCLESRYRASVIGQTQSTLTFAEYLASHGEPSAQAEGRQLDWHAIVEGWAAVFGRERLLVRPCEPGQLQGGSVFADLMDILGLAFDEGFVLRTVEQPGAGFPPEIVELLRMSNEQRTPAKHRQLAQLLNECFGESAAAARPGDYLSPAQRIALLEQVEESNRRLAQEYLGREDGRLFFEPWPDPAAPWQERSFDFQRLVPSLVELIAHLHHQTLQLSQRLKRAEQRLENAKAWLGIFGLKRRALPSPLALWRRWRDWRIVAASGLVDCRYYRETYADVAASGADPVWHYVSHGWTEGRNPSARFNTARHLAAHPDEAASRRCPLVFLAQRTPPGSR